ncbi:MAG: tetratricopeptide repeat protein [Candidatus Wallbacteria bacterium]|nr:tetratricopeptide repeat protein [Candidatus Wallbacteria bacterium]
MSTRSLGRWALALLLAGRLPMLAAHAAAEVAPVRAPSHSTGAWYWMEQGTERYLSGDNDSAAADYRRAVEADPSNPRAHYLLATAHDAGGRSSEAEAAYRKSLACDPASSQTHVALAALVAGRGDRAAAASLLDRAAQLSPKDPAVHCVRGQLELSSGQGAQAATSFAAALAANPRYDQAALGLGRAQTMAGQRAEGERTVRSASGRLAPGALEEFDRTVDAWRKAAASCAGPVVPACVAVPMPAPTRSATIGSPAARALEFARKGELRKALDLLSRAVESDPANPTLVNNLAVVQAALGYQDVALSLLELASAPASSSAARAASRNLARLRAPGAPAGRIRVEGTLALLQ